MGSLYKLLKHEMTGYVICQSCGDKTGCDMSESTLMFLVRNADCLKTAYEWAYQFRTAIDWKRWDKVTMKPSGQTPDDEGNYVSSAKMSLETFTLQYRRYLSSEYVR